MPDTRESRDNQGLDEENRQRDHELEEELEEAAEGREREETHDGAVADRQLARDE